MLTVGLNVPLVALAVNVPENVTGRTVAPEAVAAPFMITELVVVVVLKEVWVPVFVLYTFAIWNAAEGA
jgi:hypothetical protein